MTSDRSVEQDTPDNFQGLVSAGSDIAGAAVGSALGFFAAGPAGAAAGGAGGAAAAHTLRKIGQEASNRLLGPREKVRVGAAVAIAAEHIRGRTERGETPRQDDFFEEKRNHRSDAEEVAESVLLRCQREAEERKVRLMAFLIGNIAFNADINVGLAHQLVRTAEELTYRQLCILKIAAMMEDRRALHQGSYREQQSFDKPLYGVLYECYDLHVRGIINFGGAAVLGLTDVDPTSMRVQGMGADLFNEMGLSTIPQADLDPIIAQLSR
ncbi:hypothetical protein SAMN05421538_1256 [Paracoccus isoporae]|uniref:Uncharacterized protein n=2 Tax=Paracoccus isoporae TaxID=591205 RepID=A0A1G7HLV4_9RHOB|nr:hypothetical protein SAMN05421538_1256 [Paracoccus isoporae]